MTVFCKGLLTISTVVCYSLVESLSFNTLTFVKNNFIKFVMFVIDLHIICSTCFYLREISLIVIE